MELGDVLICNVGCGGPSCAFEEGHEVEVTLKNIALMEELFRCGHFRESERTAAAKKAANENLNLLPDNTKTETGRVGKSPQPKRGGIF